MADIEARQPRVFLSSVFEDIFDGSRTYVPLRRRILDNHRDLPVQLWAYDLFWPEGGELVVDADIVVDRCFAGIRDCDLFVFLLTGRHGSGVPYTDDPTTATYLEMELFAAAMLQKPILVLYERNRPSEPGLDDALTLLQRSFPRNRFVVDDEAGLYAQFRDTCTRLARGEAIAPAGSNLATLPDWLAKRRSRLAIDTELSDPRLQFLDGRFRQAQGRANPEKAAKLLDQVASGTRGEQIMPHGATLFRLWAAMRELMDQTGHISDPSLATLWDQAFGLWARSASWFGLHGHLWMGPLASIHSQIDLRRRFASVPAFHLARDVREPLGARASALYSIAGRMHSWWRKRRHYRESALLATQAIQRDGDGQQGALLIRGHCFMQLARLGYVWKMWEASADFQQALAVRQKTGARPASIGEALVAVGLSSVLTGRRRSGLAQLREGIVLLRSDSSASGLAFLARGLRSLERGAQFAGQSAIATAAREERLTLAKKIEALDQTRDP